MNNPQIFNHQVFGDLPVIVLDSVEWFGATEAAKALGFSNPYSAIANHVDEDDLTDQEVIDTLGRVQNKKFINESGLYSLIFGAAKQGNNLEIQEKAKSFKRWVTSEVLPTIRRYGAYITSRANPEMLRQIADEIEKMIALNEAAKIILPVLEEAGLKPQYRAIALKQIYRKAGMELPIEELKAERELFDLTSIAKRVGVYSKNDKPHGQAIGAIIKKLDIGEDEKELVTFEKNGHSGTAIQYTQSVIDKVVMWLKSNNYPMLISYTNSDGKEVTYSVVYKSA